MKRVVLVIGLILVAGVLFAAGPNGGAGEGKAVQARTGDCTSDCDGPDLIRDRLQLKDGSCQDDATAVAATVATAAPAGDVLQDQDRQHDADGTGDDQLQDQIHLRTGRAS